MTVLGCAVALAVYVPLVGLLALAEHCLDDRGSTEASPRRQASKGGDR